MRPDGRPPSPARRHRATAGPRRDRPRRAASRPGRRPAGGGCGRRRPAGRATTPAGCGPAGACGDLPAASSTRSAARSKSSPAIAWLTASASRPCSACQRLAARCSPGTRSGYSVEEPGAQCVSEQVVVAVPLPLVVERDDEQVPALEDLQPLAAVVAAGERVAQRPRQLREHRGVEEEPANVLGLAVEHLLDQVVQDEAVAAGERVDEAGHPAASPAPVRPRADRAASCSPAAHPSVRCSRAATCAGSRSRPMTC